MRSLILVSFSYVVYAVYLSNAALSPEEELEQVFQVDPSVRAKRDVFDDIIKVHMKVAKKELKKRLDKEGDQFKKIKKFGKLKKRPFRKIQSFLKTGKSAKKFFFADRIMQSCIRSIIKHFKGKLSRKKILGKIKGKKLSSYGGDDFNVGTTCPFKLDKPCKKIKTVNKYRTIDGSCNNRKYPIWGKSFIPFTRDLPPEYDDVFDTPRARGKNGDKLPSPRAVVNKIHVDTHVPDKINSFALMTWGQILDHDTDHTGISKFKNPETDETEDIVCGEDGCDTTVDECFPIPVDWENDSHFKVECLEFVRSQSVPNRECTMGPRQQLNQITSYLDSNFVYGSTNTLARDLRTKVKIGKKMKPGAKLRVQIHPLDKKRKPLLPTQEGGDCVDTTDVFQCFLAGDARANEQSHLTVLHTIFVREHNRIVDKLASVNPHWTQDRLYQEARRVVIAETQHIDYNEYLPLVIGEDHLDDFDLRLLKKGYFYGYNDSIDASTPNVFATVTFRFAHNTIPPDVKRPKNDFSIDGYPPLKMSETLFRPSVLYDVDNGGLDSLIRGFIKQKSEDSDRFFSEEISARLFSDNPPDDIGTDLASINIQRGRDHGIPGYNAWRKFCGLKTIDSFEELGVVLKDPDLAVKYSTLYKSVDDIDFFSAGIAEPQVKGSLLGETFLCHIGQQFRKYRFGDRFWYEGKVDNTLSFTPDQLAELRKVTFARMLCNNADDINDIQKFVMKIPSEDNPIMDCAWIPDIDFSKWAD